MPPRPWPRPRRLNRRMLSWTKEHSTIYSWSHPCTTWCIPQTAINTQTQWPCSTIVLPLGLTASTFEKIRPTPPPLPLSSGAGTRISPRCVFTSAHHDVDACECDPSCCPNAKLHLPHRPLGRTPVQILDGKGSPCSWSRHPIWGIGSPHHICAIRKSTRLG